MTFSKNFMDDFFKIPDILLQEKEMDMLMVYFLSPGIFIDRFMENMNIPSEQIPEAAAKIIRQHTDAFFSLTRMHDKPIIGFTYRSLQEQMVRDLLDRGIPIFADPERAARAIAAVLAYYRMRDGIVSEEDR
jgi:hypothetical protein